jgi:hypothetical protein
VIRSSDKILIKTFDQVKKHNFDQVNFGQVIISRPIFSQIEMCSRFIKITISYSLQESGKNKVIF